MRSDYDLGPLTMGANDLMADWDRDRFAENLDQAMEGLKRRCGLVLVTTFPDDLWMTLGAPGRWAARTREANEVLQEVADPGAWGS